MNYKWFIAFIVVILLSLTSGSYYTNYYYASHIKHFITYALTDQKILDRNFNETRILTPGQGFIIHVDVNHYNDACYADYYFNLHRTDGDGHGTDIQLPGVVTRGVNIIAHDKGHFPIDGFFNIPHDAPQGHYNLYQMAFPRCDGFSVPPYKTEVNLDIEIVDKK